MAVRAKIFAVICPDKRLTSPILLWGQCLLHGWADGVQHNLPSIVFPCVKEYGEEKVGSFCIGHCSGGWSLCLPGLSPYWLPFSESLSLPLFLCNMMNVLLAVASLTENLISLAKGKFSILHGEIQTLFLFVDFYNYCYNKCAGVGVFSLFYFHFLYTYTVPGLLGYRVVLVSNSPILWKIDSFLIHYIPMIVSPFSIPPGSLPCPSYYSLYMFH